MDVQYISTAPCAGEVIDSRCLTLSYEFYELPYGKTADLLSVTDNWVSELLRDGFISKRYPQKRMRLMPLGATNPIPINTATFRYEAFAISSRVYSASTMKSYLKDLKMGAFFSTNKLPDVSVDYPAYWDRLFPSGKESPTQIKEKILRIFSEENRKLMTNYTLPDVQASFIAAPYESNPNQYYGRFFINFSSFCLNRFLQDMANTLALFAVALSENYITMNMRVMLQPVMMDSNSPYMHYFGNMGSYDGSHLETAYSASEWYRTYYIPGVEWFNILSPLAQKHIDTLPKHTMEAYSIEVANISGGGLLIRSKKEIDQYNLCDALRLKQIMQPSLFPGIRIQALRNLFSSDPRKYMLASFPRSNWALVPIFEEEIDVVGTDVVFLGKRK